MSSQKTQKNYFLNIFNIFTNNILRSIKLAMVLGYVFHFIPIVNLDFFHINLCPCQGHLPWLNLGLCLNLLSRLYSNKKLKSWNKMNDAKAYGYTSNWFLTQILNLKDPCAKFTFERLFQKSFTLNDCPS